jgi:transposase InsO family protein
MRLRYCASQVRRLGARLISERGAPRYLRSDNDPEFVGKAILEWPEQAGIETALIDPGKPWQNGMDESFNGRLRDECLSLEWFRSRREAMVIIETWRRHYNEVRPHASLDHLTRHEFKPARQPWAHDAWPIRQCHRSLLSIHGRTRFRKEFR